MNVIRNTRLVTVFLLTSLLIVLAQESRAQVRKLITQELQEEILARCIPSSTTPAQGDVITVEINVDMTQLQPPDNRLSAYQASIQWDETVLRFVDVVPAPPLWNNPTVDRSGASSGMIDWNDFVAGGVAPADINIINFTFEVIGAPGSSTIISLAFEEMVSSLGSDFVDLLNITDCNITVQSPPEPPECTVDIQSPVEGAVVCDNTVLVTALTTKSGDNQPIQLDCDINGVTASMSGSTISAVVPLVLGTNELIATCVATDSQNDSSTCADTVSVLSPSAPACEVEITSPQSDALICGDSAQVSISTSVSAEAGTPELSCFIDSTPVTGTGPVFSAIIPLAPDQVFITANCVATDSCGNQTVCADTVRITRPDSLMCMVEITSPADGEVVCDDSIRVTGTTTVTGGVPPVEIACEVNGVPAGISGSDFTATIPAVFGDDFILATCVVTDSCGRQTFCSDTVRVVPETPISCEVDIIAPSDGQQICGDSVEVTATFQASGCPAPPTLDSCTINGIPAEVSGDSLSAVIPLVAGSNTIIAVCNFTGAGGETATCADTVSVVASPLSCTLEITSPDDSSFVCDTTATITANILVSGNVGPIDVFCFVNDSLVPGILAGENNFDVTLEPGYNSFIIRCEFNDDICSVVCSDTVVVFSDPTPPECTFNFDNLPIITGEAFDFESGIASIEIVTIDNRTLEIDSFAVGDPVVGFTSDQIDLTQSAGFTIKVTNRAGCEVLCDPIYLRLAPSDTPCDFSFILPPTDRYLHIQNHGLERVSIDINEHEVLLLASENGAGRSGNTYFIPFEGKRTIDITEFLVDGDNAYHVVCDGPPNAYADVLISDINVDDGSGTTAVDEPDGGRGALPQAFALHENYPNPFNPETRINFDVPAGWQSPVTLRIYNVQGQLVRTLLDGRVAPGSHSVTWDGRDRAGQPVSTGVYFYKIVSNDFVQIKKMLLAK